MKYEPIPKERILAIDPISRGFGYVILEEEPLQLVDWGTGVCNSESLGQAVRLLLRRYHPTVVVLEHPRMAVSGVRQTTLNRALFQVLGGMDDSDCSLRLYPRTSIPAAFTDTGALTKKEITKLIAERFPELKHRLPRTRRIWESEDARQAIFDAAALALAHTCLREQRSHRPIPA